MAIASTVTLDDGTTSITINGPTPSNFELLSRTISELTANRDIYSYQITSSKIRRWPLVFNDLTTAQKDNLVNFFTDDVIGPTNAFSYTHTDGTVYSNVRFENDSLQVERVHPGIFRVSVVLRVAALIK